MNMPTGDPHTKQEEDQASRRSASYSPSTPTPQDATSSTPGVLARLGQTCSNCGTSRTPLWRRDPSGSIICNACGLYQKARNSARPVPSRSIEPSDDTAIRRQLQLSAEGQSPAASEDMLIDTTALVCTGVPGSCPGGGQCNGTGGADGCNGCPAFNNRLPKKPQTGPNRSLTRVDSGRSRISGQPSSAALEVDPAPSTTNESESSCKNCGTTVTPLWRRDEHGHTICNACGLYHKLHGSHRPVTMKKSTIKRRKRVVPYVVDQMASPSQSSEASASPEPSPRIPAHESRPRFTPAIDFTGYLVSRGNDLPNTLPPIQLHPDHENRKRTLSISQRSSNLPGIITPESSISSNRKLASIPSLLNPSQSPTQKEQQEVVIRDKENKKARLKQEAEGLRLMLLAKEREIQELNNDD